MSDFHALLPSNAVEIAGSRTFTTSLMIADVFGKLHKHVLRDIDALDCSPEFHGANFGLMTRAVDPAENTRSLPGPKFGPSYGVYDSPESRFGVREERYFNISRDGFTFLVMGYRGQKAAQFKEAYIRRFNEMEAKIQGSAPSIAPPTVDRWLATHTGNRWVLFEIPKDAVVLPARDWPKAIANGDFPRELLPEVVAAVGERMKGLPNAEQSVRPSAPSLEPESATACLDFILNARLYVASEHWAGDATTRELIGVARGRASRDIPEREAVQTLARYGMRLEGEYLLVSNTNKDLAGVLRGTRWTVAWRKTLIQIQGAHKSPKPIHIGGHVSRCVAVPLWRVEGGA